MKRNVFRFVVGLTISPIILRLPMMSALRMHGDGRIRSSLRAPHWMGVSAEQWPTSMDPGDHDLSVYRSDSSLLLVGFADSSSDHELNVVVGIHVRNLHLRVSVFVDAKDLIDEPLANATDIREIQYHRCEFVEP